MERAMNDIREVLAAIEASIDNPWKGVNVRRLRTALRRALEVHWETCSCDEARPPCRFVRKITEALDEVTR
jgi:hypothetical protein